MTAITEYELSPEVIGRADEIARMALAEIGVALSPHPEHGHVYQGDPSELVALLIKASNIARTAVGAPTFPDVATYLEFQAHHGHPWATKALSTTTQP